MDQLQHDSAASLRVDYLPSRSNGSGWYVVRTCCCHSGEPITQPFESREAAERAMRVLDEDAQRYAISS